MFLNFISSIFSNIEENQRNCILLVDEVYVKSLLLYLGGSLFRKAENNPELLANTVLGIMVKCLKGRPSFLCKMIPVCHLDASFLFEQVCYVINSIKSSNGKVISVICDGNRTNQAFFNLFERVEEKPLLTKCGIFLLFDYVHLIKNIRNNWITEKTQELNFENDQSMTAEWSDLKCILNFKKD